MSPETSSERQKPTFYSSLGAVLSEVKVDGNNLILLADEWAVEVHLYEEEHATLVREVIYRGTREERLALHQGTSGERIEGQTIG